MTPEMIAGSYSVSVIEAAIRIIGGADDDENRITGISK